METQILDKVLSILLENLVNVIFGQFELNTIVFVKLALISYWLHFTEEVFRAEKLILFCVFVYKDV